MKMKRWKKRKRKKFILMKMDNKKNEEK